MIQKLKVGIDPGHVLPRTGKGLDTEVNEILLEPHGTFGTELQVLPHAWKVTKGVGPSASTTTILIPGSALYLSTNSRKRSRRRLNPQKLK
jgi:hypothetical protein